MKNVGFLPLFFSTTLASFIVDKITKASTCEPTLLQWQGGVAPWMLSVLATDETTLENLGTFKRTSFSWNVDFIAGTSVVIRALDSTGKSATSNRFTIQAGTTNCVLHEVNPPDSSLDTQPQPDSVPNALNPPSSPPSSSQAATVTVSVTTTTSLITSLSPSSRSTSSTTTTGSSSQLATSPHTSTSVNATQQTTATPPSASFAEPPSVQKKSVAPGPILAALIPPLFLLVIVGTYIVRWRRRQRASVNLSSLESQTSPSWFKRRMHRSAFSDGGQSPTETPGAAALQSPAQLLALGVAAVAAAATSDFDLHTTTTPLVDSPQTPWFEKPPLSPSEPSTLAESTPRNVANIGALQIRIDTSLEENAILASLASAAADAPPPAYS